MVTDQGPGIDPARAAAMFKEWYRAPGVDTPGLGLGLYIVRKIVELHGGQVRVEGRPGRGSTFVIVLPRRRPRSADLRGADLKGRLDAL